MLSIDSRLEILPEDHLTVGIEFRSNDVHGLVRIHGHDTDFRQLLCEKCTDYFASLHTDNRINHHIIHILLCQRPGCFRRIAQPGLGGC
jgi:hypothetical protein